MADNGFWAHAQAHPDRVAIIDDGGAPLTYGELFARQNRAANALRAHGLTVGGTVAALRWNQPQFLELGLASGQIGTYFLPINWHLTAPEVAHILTDYEAGVLLADERVGSVAIAAADAAAMGPESRLAVGDITGFRSYESFIETHSATRPDDLTAGETMLYTSGTTGRPKGIRRPLSGAHPEAMINAIAGLASEIFQVPPGEAVQLVTGPMYHATPGALATIALHLGHTVVLMDKWEPEHTLELIERYQVSYMHMVPTMFQRMLALPEATRRRYDHSSLRSVVHGAAPCPPDVKRKMIEWWGPVINEYYGSSEGGGAYVKAEDWLKRPGTVGLPWPGSAIKIFDDAGNECPPNTAGTVYIKMPGFKFEYHKAPEKTRDSTRDDFFTVGDVGFLDDDGFLFLSGRSAELIISGGVNIYPAEIESHLAAHPAVADVAVIGVPNDEWGEEVKAIIEPIRDVTPSDALAEDLLAHCREGLAGYKVPRSVEFRNELPRSATGKLYKRLLRDDFWATTGRQL